MQSGVVVKKNRAFSVDLCWLQSLKFSVHLIDLLSIFLRYSGFAGIQKAVVNQALSRPPHSGQDHFSGAGLALGSALELLFGSATELVMASCCINSTFCHVTIQSRNGLLLLHTIREDST